MFVGIVIAVASGFFGMIWLDPMGRGKARWNYTLEDWRGER